jgi:hypothetical protein
MKLLLAAAAMATAITPPGFGDWDLKVWPNAALMAQHATKNGAIELRRSFSCVRGDPQVSLRIYHPAEAPRPEGARRGCDTRCRTEMVLTDSDGRRPSGYSERKGSWPELRGEALVAGAALADGFARACRLVPEPRTRDTRPAPP